MNWFHPKIPSHSCRNHVCSQVLVCAISFPSPCAASPIPTSEILSFSVPFFLLFFLSDWRNLSRGTLRDREKSQKQQQKRLCTGQQDVMSHDNAHCDMRMYAHAHAHAHTRTHTITSGTLKEITNTCTHNLRMKLLEDTNTHVRQHIGRHATRKAENAKTQTQGKRGVRKKYEDEKRCSDCCSCCLCCCSEIILLLGFSRFSISRRAWVHV